MNYISLAVTNAHLKNLCPISRFCSSEFVDTDLRGIEKGRHGATFYFYCCCHYTRYIKLFKYCYFHYEIALHALVCRHEMWGSFLTSSA